MKDPETKEEWQDAADAAHACLLLHDARLYGLVIGGPEVNTDRCIQILEKAKARRIYPRPDCIERFIAELNAGQ